MTSGMRNLEQWDYYLAKWSDVDKSMPYEHQFPPVTQNHLAEQCTPVNDVLVHL